jgi:prolyl oligopeptidase PreP (S9A serine peptidase family)
VHDLDSGKRLDKIPIPVENGQVFVVSGRKKDSQFFFDFENYVTPLIIYRGEFLPASNGKEQTNNIKIEIKEFKRTKANGFDTSQLEVKKVYYESRDGTKVDIFLNNSRYNNSDFLNQFNSDFQIGLILFF